MVDVFWALATTGPPSKSKTTEPPSKPSGRSGFGLLALQLMVE
jgi:hypothetical protein